MKADCVLSSFVDDIVLTYAYLDWIGRQQNQRGFARPCRSNQNCTLNNYDYYYDYCIINFYNY